MSRIRSAPPQALRALDPELPFLATEAAVDIDNLLSTGNQDFQAMQNLSKLLRNSLSKLPGDERPRLLLDLATLSVVQDAFVNAQRMESQEEIERLLVEQATQIAEWLDQPNNNRDKLPAARDFCLHLSKAAMAYRALVDDMEVLHFF